jgi:hypothetical protein
MDLINNGFTRFIPEFASTKTLYFMIVVESGDIAMPAFGQATAHPSGLSTCCCAGSFQVPLRILLQYGQVQTRNRCDV